MAKYYYEINGQENGPIEPSKIRELAATGQLNPDSLIRKEGSSDKIKASRIKGLSFNEKPTHKEMSEVASKESDIYKSNAIQLKVESTDHNKRKHLPITSNSEKIHSSEIYEINNSYKSLLFRKIPVFLILFLILFSMKYYNQDLNMGNMSAETKSDEHTPVSEMQAKSEIVKAGGMVLQNNGEHEIVLGPEVTDEISTNVLAISNVKSLTIPEHAKLTIHGIKQVLKLKSLKTLIIKQSELLSNEVLKAVSELQQLENLFTSDAHVTDIGSGFIGNLKSLRYLSIGGDDLTDEGVRNLKNLINLQGLVIHANKVTGAGLDVLKGLSNITDISIESSLFNDQGMEHLNGFPRITHVDLTGCNITDKGLANIKNIQGLRSLNLTRTKVTDGGLLHVSELKGIEHLFLDSTNISDAGLHFIKNLKQLRTLDLNSTKISDVGLSELNAPHLYYLNLENTNAKERKLLKTNKEVQEFLAGIRNSNKSIQKNVDEKFEYYYRLGNKVLKGKSEILDDHLGENDDVVEYIKADANKDLISVTLNHSKLHLSTSFLNIENGVLNFGESKQKKELLLNFDFYVEKEPPYSLFGSVSIFMLNSQDINSILQKVGSPEELNLQQPQNDINNLELAFVRDNGFPLIHFGSPTNVEGNRILYSDFSPANQMVLINKHVGKSRLNVRIGDQLFQVDESVEKILVLLERSASYLRFLAGARDSESRQSIWDNLNEHENSKITKKLTLSPIADAKFEKYKSECLKYCKSKEEIEAVTKLLERKGDLSISDGINGLSSNELIYIRMVQMRRIFDTSIFQTLSLGELIDRREYLLTETKDLTDKLLLFQRSGVLPNKTTSIRATIKKNQRELELLKSEIDKNSRGEKNSR
jgi:hypothetical protein